jgi:phage shock protein E
VSLDITTILTLAVIIAFVLFKFVLAKRTAPEVIAQKLQAGATVLDVRSEAEFRGGAYRGAINVPVQVLPSKLDRIPRNKPVVVYCASGARSAAAVRILEKAGYTDVSNAGGLHHMPARAR